MVICQKKVTQNYVVLLFFIFEIAKKSILTIGRVEGVV